MKSNKTEKKHQQKMLQLNSMSMVNLSINDINELASEIGKECERLIAEHGIDDINEIVSKCITALQMLEKMSKENETANQEIYELHEKICALEKGKLEKVESQKAFEKVKFVTFFYSRCLRLSFKNFNPWMRLVLSIYTVQFLN